MNLKININQLAIIVFISLFIFSSISACQERETKITPQEMLFQGVEERDQKKGYELVQQAINLGVDIDLKYENDYTALIRAAMNGNKEIVQLLLDAKVNPDIQNDDGDTALIWAASNSNKEPIKTLITKLLLDAKANPDIQNNYGYTALSRAAMQGNREIVQLLLNANADFNIQSNNGNTALMWALQFNHKEIAQLLLLKANINIDAQDNRYGNTALIMAAIRGNKEIVQLLLDANVDINIKNKENKTALSRALEQKHFAQRDRDAVLEKNLDEIIKMLKDEQRKRREIVQKEASEHLPNVLANLVSEYFVSCPSKADKDVLVDKKKTL